MQLSIEKITERLNDIVIPYLVKSNSQFFKEEFGYPRRTALWPFTSEGYCMWVFQWEKEPYFQSTSEIRLIQITSSSEMYKGFCPGFYMSAISEYKKFGNDLEAVLLEFKKRLDEVPKRKFSN